MNPSLEQRIAALEKWQSEKKLQQITFPLDQSSIDTLINYFMRINRSAITALGVGGLETLEHMGSQGTIQFVVSQNYYTQYSVTPSTDTFTLVGSGAYGFPDDTEVFVAGEVVPAPLVTATTYYVINSTNNGNTFKLSATLGGAAINITDQGTGDQFIYVVS